MQKVGRRLATHHFVLVFTPGTTGRARLGITVSSRVGDAVTRNRVKRFLRELFRTCFRCQGGTNEVVVIARAGAEALKYADVVSELEGPLAAAIHC